MSIQLRVGRNAVPNNPAKDLIRSSVEGKSFDLRLVDQINGFMQAITEPAPLIAGAVAGPIFSVVQSPMMSFLLSKPAGLLSRGLGLRMVSAAVALPGEIAAFGLTQRAVQQVLNPGSLDWSKETLWHEAGGLALTFGLFKMHGRLAQTLLPKGLQHWQPVAGAVGMYSGILHSHLWLGWRKSATWEDKLTQSLETFFQLKAMGHITHYSMGSRYNAWVESLETRAEEKINLNLNLPQFSESLIALGPTIPRSEIPEQDNYTMKMKNNGGDGDPPDRGSCKIIPFRRDTIVEDLSPDRNTPIFPPMGERIEAQGLRDHDPLALLSLIHSLLPNRGPLGPASEIPQAGGSWERMEKLEIVLGSMEPQKFHPELLFGSYLEFLGTYKKPFWGDSIAKYIPMELLLEEVLPIYLVLRRNHLPLAYDELAHPTLSDNPHWDSWRATTYLTMRLLEGVDPTGQMLFEISEHFLRMVPEEKPQIMGAGMNQLAQLRMKGDHKTLKKFRTFLFKRDSPQPQTLLAIDAFLEYPEDLIGGLYRLANDKIIQRQKEPSLSTRTLLILNAAHRIGRQ